MQQILQMMFLYHVKIVIQNSCVKLDAFLRQNGSFIFPPNGGKCSEAKVLITSKDCKMRKTELLYYALLDLYIIDLIP